MYDMATLDSTITQYFDRARPADIVYFCCDIS